MHTFSSIVIGLLLGCGVGRLGAGRLGAGRLDPRTPVFSRLSFDHGSFAASGGSTGDFSSAFSVPRRLFSSKRIPKYTDGIVWNDLPSYTYSLLNIFPSVTCSQPHCPGPPLPTAPRSQTHGYDTPNLNIFFRGAQASKIPKQAVDLKTMCLNPLINTTVPLSAAQWTAAFDQAIESLRESVLDAKLCAFHDDLCADGGVSATRNDTRAQRGVLVLVMDTDFLVSLVSLFWTFWGLGSVGARARRLGLRLFVKANVSFGMRMATGMRVVCELLFCSRDLATFTEFVLCEVVFGLVTVMGYTIVAMVTIMRAFYFLEGVPRSYERRQLRVLDLWNDINEDDEEFGDDVTVSPCPSFRDVATQVDIPAVCKADSCQVSCYVHQQSEPQRDDAPKSVPAAPVALVSVGSASVTSTVARLIATRMFGLFREVRLSIVPPVRLFRHSLSFGPSRYRIVRRLAHVGAVKVVLVEKLRTSARYVLHASETSFKGVYSEQNVAQYKALCMLRECAWVTKIVEAFCTDLQVYVVTEHYPRGTLRDYMFDNYGYLDAEVATFYLAEMFVAIQALHAIGVIHLRISVDNTLLDEDGHIVLANFGFSKTFENGVVPGYITPGGAFEDIMCTGAVDFYNMAHAHHEMYTGRALECAQPYPSTSCQLDFLQEGEGHVLDFWAMIMNGFPYHVPSPVEIEFHPIFIDTDWGAIENRSAEPPRCTEPRIASLYEDTRAEYAQEKAAFKKAQRKTLKFNVADVFD